ncbi:MAG: pyrroline-5-carboxylate reductase, partial [Aquirufa sp.]
MNVHIIGGGNLGASIAIGIAKFTESNQVTVTRRNTANILHLEQLGVTVSTDNKHHIQDADIIILTIKPYQVDTVLAEILPVITNKTIASAGSGLSIENLQNKIGATHQAVRIMPNIAAQFGASATCIAFQENNKEAAQNVVRLFEGLGTAPIIDEKLMDAATVLAASGTAFALRYIRASMQAGIEIGFDWQTALAISAQTVKGAAEMLLEEKTHPEQLIDRVTTPQGCTIAGLNEMELHGFSSSLIKGIKTSLKQI